MAVPAARAARFWPYAEPYLEDVAARFPGEMDLDKVRAELASGHTQLWVAWDDRVIGAALTQIIAYPEFSAVRILALGGEDFCERWRDTCVAWFERYAEHHGCNRLEFYGRRGWQRRLPGWEVNRIMMTRDVDDGR